jgi:hypothetical protein
MIVKTYKNGGRRTYDENGELHSYGDEPSIFMINGNEVRKTWHFHGKIHREGIYKPMKFHSPAVINHLINGTRYELKYYEYGKLHRMDGPAVDRRTYPANLDDMSYDMGTMEYECYYIDGLSYGHKDEYGDNVDHIGYKNAMKIYRMIKRNKLLDEKERKKNILSSKKGDNEIYDMLEI